MIERNRRGPVATPGNPEPLRSGVVPAAGDTLSTRDAAAMLGLSERTIRRAIRSGALRAERGEWAYHIDRESLDRYAAATSRPAGPRPMAQVVPFPGNEMSPVPEPLSSFIGRNADVAAVLELLDDPAVRLLTLTGPGGIGKTRLAVEVARAFPPDQAPDGVAFIALADLHAPERVLPAIAKGLGLRERPGADPKAQLRAFLRPKRLLLVLDNFEHVLPATVVIGELLAAAPALKVLITSRAPLRLAGERDLAVRPLAVAAGDTSADVLTSDAGRLFVARAREHDASFALDDGNAPAIAAICARLDGLPLAIELAAARVNVLPPHQLLDRLQRRLPLLTRGARNAATRHSTMRDAIRWSYDSLQSDQQRCFRRLAVFSGGATLAAAQAVAGEPDAALDTEIVDVIAELIDQSLLTPQTGLDGERRFRMLETIREFGLEQLAVAGEEREARMRHAAYFLDLSLRMRALASTHASSAPYATLAAEYPNLQEALLWLEAEGPAAAFVALVADLCEFWYASSFGRDAAAWIARAMSRQEEAGPFDRARLLVGNAAILLEQGDADRAGPSLAQGLELLRVVGDPLYTSRALILRAAELIAKGRFADAEPPLLEALSLAESIPDAFLRAVAAGRALSNLCCAARGQGDFVRATEYGEAALRRYKGKPFNPVIAMTFIDLGAVANDAGDHELALSRLLHGIALMGEGGDMRQVADALSGLASIATAWGEARTALLLFGAADALRERVGVAMVWPADIAAMERSLAALRQSCDQRMIEDTLAEGRTLAPREARELASTLTAPVVKRASRNGHRDDLLTNRERDVLHLLAQHQSDREIAEALFLGLRTVNWHVRSILGKLGVSSRREAITMARAQGLV